MAGITFSSTGSGAGHAITEEGGSALTQRPTLNFIGSNVTAADDAGNNRTNITVGGGGGSATRGTFTDGSLVAGVLTITHSLGLSAPYPVIVKIFRDTGVEVIPSLVTGSANSVAVDLTAYQPLANTWGYIYM